MHDCADCPVISHPRVKVVNGGIRITISKQVCGAHAMLAEVDYMAWDAAPRRWSFWRCPNCFCCDTNITTTMSSMVVVLLILGRFGRLRSRIRGLVAKTVVDSFLRL